MKVFLALAWILMTGMLYASPPHTTSTDTTTAVNGTETYKAFQNDTSLGILISTTSQNTMMTMLHQGVTVYFDCQGKKKKEVFISYPLAQNQDNNAQKPKRSEIQELPPIAKILKNLPENGKYKNFDLEQEFHTLLNDLGIEITFNHSNNTGITYSLQVPKDKVNSHPRKNLSKLAIGVVLGKPMRERPDSQKPPQDNSSGPGGNQLGNQRGGQGRGGSLGERGSRQRQSPKQKQQKSNTIEYWFDANLNNQ